MTTVIPAATPDPTRAEVVGRVEDSFRDVYLTLVSIIQGVALGYLVQVIGPDYRSLGVDHGARGAAIVAFIVAVWQEYMVGATTQAWIPGVLDSLAPFLIGVGEFLMISALSASSVSSKASISSSCRDIHAAASATASATSPAGW